MSDSIQSEVVITGTVNNSEEVPNIQEMKYEVPDGEYVEEDLKCFLERKHERHSNLEGYIEGMIEIFSEEMKSILNGDEAECLEELSDLSIAMAGQSISCLEPTLKIEIEEDEEIKYDMMESSRLEIFKETEVGEKENDSEEIVIKKTDR